MPEQQAFRLAESGTGATVGDYSSEEAVLALTLLYRDPDGVQHALAEGEALVARARQRTTR